MKHYFKKVAAIALAVLMCATAIVPTFAATGTCPGTDKTHTAYNCTYNVVSDQKVTCTDAGIVTGQCTTCGKSFVVSQTAAAGHSWEVTSSATCTEAGTKTCKVCKAVEEISTAAGHKFGEWIVDGECAIGARRTRTCSVCKFVEKHDMTTEHVWTLVSYKVPTTCTEKGVANYVCENKGCGVTYSEEIWLDVDDLHDFKAWADLTADDAEALWGKGTVPADPNLVVATCTVKGVTSKICTACGEIAKVFGTTTAHDTKDVAAVAHTCTTNGVKAHQVCKDCRAIIMDGKVVTADKTVDAAAHTLITTNFKDATCDVAGYKAEKCTVEGCTFTKTTTIDAKGSHLYYLDLPEAAKGGTADNTKAKDIKTKLGTSAGWASDELIAMVSVAYVPATCTANGYREWKCLNFHQEDTDGDGDLDWVQCTTTKRQAWDKYAKTGHDYEDAPIDASSLRATCTTDGTIVRKCKNGCGDFTTEKENALGHTLGAKVWKDGVEANCTVSSSYTQTCSVCSYTTPETAVAASADWHTAANLLVTMKDGTRVKLADLTDASAAVKYTPATCTTAGVVNMFCGVCTYGPADVTLPALNHKYPTISADKTTADITKATTDGYTVTEFQAGDCEKVRIVKIMCKNGCGDFKYFEDKTTFGNGHQKVYKADSYKGATCTQNGNSMQWLCKVTTCVNYEKATTKVYNQDKIYYATHLKDDGTGVTYKDVPDTAISGAKDVTAASAVKAPVDANGNVTKAIAIPGTSLVWRYVYVTTDCAEDSVTVGGLWCVDCDTAVGGSTATVREAKAHNHVAAAEATDATCLSYGFTSYVCADCGDVQQRAYKKVAEHDYKVLNSLNNTCVTDGYAVGQCKLCNFIITVTIPASGHHNAAGDEITSSCLDLPLDRKCKDCGLTIAKAHAYVNGACKECGIPQA